MNKVSDLKIKIFADGADRSGMLEMYSKPFIKGLTTNPTLMNKAGVRDYSSFCKDILKEIKDKPISFEVFSDDFSEMERQALEIASWGPNVFVKIPIMNTNRESACSSIKRLASEGVQLNITAIMSLDQVNRVQDALNPNIPSFVSVFAGRIADTGRDPVPIMSKALEILEGTPKSELIWASPRELLNIFQANEIGCHIITVTNDLLKKLDLVNKDLEQYSLETVEMFYRDAVAAGYKLFIK